jgi:hypothetical protein
VVETNMLHKRRFNGMECKTANCELYAPNVALLSGHAMVYRLGKHTHDAHRGTCTGNHYTIITQKIPARCAQECHITAVYSDVDVDNQCGAMSAL